MRFPACVLLVVAVIGCSHPSTSGSGKPEAPRSILIPPKILQTSTMLSFRSKSATPFHGDIEVPVNAEGRPDAMGLRVMGRMDDLMKQDIKEWLQGVTFAPAKRDGVPVDGIYKMTFR